MLQQQQQHTTLSGTRSMRLVCNVCSQSVGQRQHTYDRAYVRLITLRSRVPQHWELSIGRLRSTGVAWLVSDVASSYAGVWLGNLFRAHSCAQWLILSGRPRRDVDHAASRRAIRSSPRCVICLSIPPLPSV